VTLNTFTVEPLFPRITNWPLTVEPESSHVAYQAVCVTPAASTLSMKIDVTEAIVALL
jgi:hypothetical protein